MQQGVVCGKLCESIKTTGSLPSGNTSTGRPHMLQRAEMMRPGRASMRKRKKRKDEKAGKVYTYRFMPQ